MTFDFSVLDNIGKDAPQKPLQDDTATFKAKKGKCTTPPEKTPETSVITNLMKRDRAEVARAKAVYSEYQQNIRNAGDLRTDIIKGIQRAEDPAGLLLKAMECISLMTGDKVIYTQAKADIKQAYGYTLGQPAPLEKKLEEKTARTEEL